MFTSRGWLRAKRQIGPAVPGMLRHRRVEIAFDATPEHLHAVRTFVALALAYWGMQDVAEDAVLLTNEIVTNAVRHVGTGYRLTVRFDAPSVVIEVFDCSTHLPHRIIASQLAEGGRGLVVVEEVADSWGTRVEESGKTVWFSLRSEIDVSTERQVA